MSEELKALSDEVQALQDRVEGLERSRFQAKVFGSAFGGAIAISVAIVTGLTLQSVPRAVSAGLEDLAFADLEREAKARLGEIEIYAGTAKTKTADISSAIDEQTRSLVGDLETLSAKGTTIIDSLSADLGERAGAHINEIETLADDAKTKTAAISTEIEERTRILVTDLETLATKGTTIIATLSADLTDEAGALIKEIETSAANAKTKAAAVSTALDEANAKFSEMGDGKFDTLSCRKLEVLNSDGKYVISLNSYKFGGVLHVRGTPNVQEDIDIQVGILADSTGGTVWTTKKGESVFLNEHPSPEDHARARARLESQR